MPWDKSTDPEELRLFEEYNIKFFGSDKHLPSNHQRSFRAIQELGRAEFSKSVRPSSKRFWNWELNERAKKLRAIALRTQDAGPELHWRLEIESIVYERFHLRVNCQAPECEGRLWRSKTEVVAEVEGPISDGITLEKVTTRPPCQCSDKYAKSCRVDPNSPFTNTADEMFEHHGAAIKDKLKNRKPDRVFGINDVEKASISPAYTRRIKRQMYANQGVYCSPFKSNASGRRVLFPFLIAEAKSGKDYAADFLACQHQTAFPIWKLLHLQEELEKVSQNSSPELGGPLIWFFANRGAIWKLYGCYIKHNIWEKSLYIIHELWEGSILDLNCALQLLLIVDYIFDWARDLYLPNIQRQFEVASIPVQSRPAQSQPFGFSSTAYRTAQSSPALPKHNNPSPGKENETSSQKGYKRPTVDDADSDDTFTHAPPKKKKKTSHRKFPTQYRGGQGYKSAISGEKSADDFHDKLFPSSSEDSDSSDRESLSFRDVPVKPAPAFAQTQPEQDTQKPTPSFVPEEPSQRSATAKSSPTPNYILYRDLNRSSESEAQRSQRRKEEDDARLEKFWKDFPSFDPKRVKEDDGDSEWESEDGVAHEKEDIETAERTERLLEMWREFPVVTPGEGFGFAFRYLEDGPRQGKMRAFKEDS